MTATGGCFDPDHFAVDDDGALRPQPWMQWRHLSRVEAVDRTGAYPVAGGAPKNDLIHALRLSWLNTTPLPQHVYGMVTRGGCRVSLQPRSRGYLQLASAQRVHPADAGALTVTSRIGVGGDLGRGGSLALATTYAVVELRQNSVTIPVAAETAGWATVAPGQTFHARAELRFITEAWESAVIDGGDSGSESSWQSGGTALDLYAVPVIPALVTP